MSNKAEQYTFGVVMHEWQRLCNDHREKTHPNSGMCLDCPIGAYCSLWQDDVNPDKISEIAEAVMKWAKENPEPIRPNWIAWLYEQGVFETRVYGGNKHTCCLTKKAYDSMPEDICEALDIGEV